MCRGRAQPRFFVPSPCSHYVAVMVEVVVPEDDVRGLTLSSRHWKGRKGGKTVCEDDVEGLTSSSKRVGAPDRTCSVLPRAFWRVFDAGRTVDVLPETLEGHRVVKLAGRLVRIIFAILFFVGGILGLSLVNSIFVDAMAADNNDEVLNKLAELERKIDDLTDKSQDEAS